MSPRRNRYDPFLCPIPQAPPTSPKRLSDTAVPEMEGCLYIDRSPCQAMVFFLLERALRDALSNDKKLKEEALEWLLSKEVTPQSAAWWAELAELEHVLRICRVAAYRTDLNYRHVRYGNRYSEY